MFHDHNRDPSDCQCRASVPSPHQSKETNCPSLNQDYLDLGHRRLPRASTIVPGWLQLPSCLYSVHPSHREHRRRHCGGGCSHTCTIFSFQVLDCHQARACPVCKAARHPSTMFWGSRQKGNESCQKKWRESYSVSLSG